MSTKRKVTDFDALYYLMLAIRGEGMVKTSELTSRASEYGRSLGVTKARCKRVLGKTVKEIFATKPIEKGD